MLPAAKGTRWLLSFWLDDRKVAGECVVKTHDPAFGMGMEFSGLTDDQQERLEKFLRRQSNIFFSHLAFLNTTNQRLQLVLEDRGALKGRFVASRTTPQLNETV
jgi:hypothetical protein